MNNRVFRIMSAAISTLILIISVTGCGQEQPKNQAIVSKKITIGVGSGLFLSAIWIAENKGYFQEENLDLTIKKFASGKASLLNMLDGGVDISTSAPTPLVFTSFDRNDFLIFATFAYSDDNIKVIANKDKGINAAKDLKGKRIGIVSGSSTDFFLATYLAYNGLSESDIELINISPSNLPNALYSGEVDTIAIWEPYAYNAQKLLGDKAMRLQSSEIYRETFNLTVMRDFAQESPDVLKRLLKAIIRATTFINANREETQRIVSEKLNIDKALTIQLWDNYVFDVYLDQALILTLEDEARWAMKNKLTLKNKLPNYLDFIYPDALKATKPRAFSIIL